MLLEETLILVEHAIEPWKELLGAELSGQRAFKEGLLGSWF
jgi:hypothetical protein